MADTDPSATLAELSTSLTALEQALDPLLATPLQQHLEHSAAAADSPLLQARAHILASYVVHDLVWGQSAHSLPASAPRALNPQPTLAVYLKAAGIEPASHPVMQELVRC
jgi:exosome complex protein LRP1